MYFPERRIAVSWQLSTFFGGLLGYLFGGLVAGIFLVIEKEKPAEDEAGEADGGQVDLADEPGKVETETAEAPRRREDEEG
jgi:hypothetical protein